MIQLIHTHGLFNSVTTFDIEIVQIYTYIFNFRQDLYLNDHNECLTS